MSALNRTYLPLWLPVLLKKVSRQKVGCLVQMELYSEMNPAEPRTNNVRTVVTALG